MWSSDPASTLVGKRQQRGRTLFRSCKRSRGGCKPRHWKDHAGVALQPDSSPLREILSEAFPVPDLTGTPQCQAGWPDGSSEDSVARRCRWRWQVPVMSRCQAVEVCNSGPTLESKRSPTSPRWPSDGINIAVEASAEPSCAAAVFRAEPVKFGVPLPYRSKQHRAVPNSDMPDRKSAFSRCRLGGSPALRHTAVAESREHPDCSGPRDSLDVS